MFPSQIIMGSFIPEMHYLSYVLAVILFYMSFSLADTIPKCVVRAGFIFTQEIGGLQTSGRERLMEKVASTQSRVMLYLVISKMDGVMATFFALMLTVQGWYLLFSIQCLYNKSPHLLLFLLFCPLNPLCIHFRYIEVWNEGYLMGRENLDSGSDTA